MLSCKSPALHAHIDFMVFYILTSSWRPFGPAWLCPSRPSGVQAVWPTQKSEKPLKIRSFWHQRISGSSFRSRDMARNPKKIQKSRNTEIQKSKNSICFWKSEKPSKIRSFWHQRISRSSFRSRDMARNPKKIQKSKNSIFLKIWKALKNPVVLTPADLR